MTIDMRSALERVVHENGPVVIDWCGEKLAWRPLDYGTWTALEASPDTGGWQDISTAPKDGTEIDIWVSGDGPRRIADCRWAKPTKANWGDRYGDDRDLPTQWVTRSGFALDRRNGTATHWRYPPAAPTPKGSKA